ncbi:AraC family transcriptional regulator [Paenibacillus sp. GCM10023252]|uniref:AraC family transcriptional regulator n=1 Tax=Paenibacillus sp. GCM10023252 TaxID=3252649 RepID=UPI003622DF24
METDYESIVINQINQLQAEIIMSAYSESPAGWLDQHSEPDYYRLCYVIGGRGWYRYDDTEHEIVPGRLYLLPLGMSQSFEVEGGELFCRYWCHFRTEMGRQLVELLQLPLSVEVKDEAYMTQLFHRLISLDSAPALTRNLRLRSVLLEIVAYYLDESMVGGIGNSSEDIDQLKDVFAYIEERLADNIQVEDLARAAYVHPNYFITLFRNMTGCSPIQYVTQRRLLRAKELLTSTDEPISAVARRVGMQNHYLSRVFKRHIGLTPMQYRRIGQGTTSGSASLERST